jgi:hypothetical protein
VDKTFITYDEIHDAVCREDVGTRLRALHPRQVLEMMEACGRINVYTIENARALEKAWMYDVDHSTTPWRRATPEEIAAQCRRVIALDEPGGGVDLDRSAASHVARATGERYAQARVSLVKTVQALLPLVHRLHDNCGAIQAGIERVSSR